MMMEKITPAALYNDNNNKTKKKVKGEENGEEGIQGKFNQEKIGYFFFYIYLHFIYISFYNFI